MLRRTTQIGSITEGGVEQVIAAVGDKFAPADLDRQRLMRALDVAHRKYELARARGSPPPAPWWRPAGAESGRPIDGVDEVDEIPLHLQIPFSTLPYSLICSWGC
jgi:hypothetical protein